MGYHLQFAGCTDPGLIRERNEDMWAALPQFGFYVLADGMGGHLGGHRASRIAVDVLCRFVEKHLQQVPPTLAEAKRIIEEGIAQVNQEIYEASLSNPLLRGMGTTLCCLYLYKDHMIYAHVGDSRIYQRGHRRLRQLTKDHSLVAEMVAAGQLAPQEAQSSSYRHVITRALGTHPSVEASIDEISLAEGDCFLMCTDGLTDQVSHVGMETILNTSTSLQEAAERLVQAVIDAGGQDNVTVVIVEVNDARQEENLSR